MGDDAQGQSKCDVRATGQNHVKSAQKICGAVNEAIDIAEQIRLQLYALSLRQLFLRRGKCVEALRPCFCYLKRLRQEN